MNVTLEEKAILDLLKENPQITQKQISEEIKKSDRTVKRIISSLQKKGIIVREGGKRFGCWNVLK